MLFRLSGRALLILCFLFMPGVAGAVVCPASIAEVIAVLNLGKDPICIGEDSQDNPVSVPLDFKIAGNGALVLLDQLPAGGIGNANNTTVTRGMISDILVFANALDTLKFFSDPFPDNFVITDTLTMTLDQILDPTNRRVVYLQEGFLLDPRTGTRPLGNNPVDLTADFGLMDVSIYITPRGNAQNTGQAYVIFSDNPTIEREVPLPGTLALFGLAILLMARTRRRL